MYSAIKRRLFSNWLDKASPLSSAFFFNGLAAVETLLPIAVRLNVASTLVRYSNIFAAVSAVI